MRSRARLLLTGLAAAGLAGLAVLHACGSGPTHGAGPTILTEPANEVVFAGVVSGSTATQPVTVRNVGSSDLVVSSIALEVDPTSGFAKGDDAAALVGIGIAPGDERTFNVTYTPTSAADYQGVLRIASNDFVTPKLALTVRATQQGPRIVCDPPFIDFALVENRQGPVTATCRNDGTDPFPVDSFFLDGSAEFEVSEVNGLTNGATLAVGQSFTVTVAYTMSLAGNGKAFFVVKPAAAGVGRGQLALYGVPVANAGADVSAPPLTVVKLNGAASRAPGNASGVSVYSWNVVKAPAGSKTAEQFQAGEAQIIKQEEGPKCAAGQNRVMAPCFFPDVPGVYTFSLAVRDHRADCPLGRAPKACADAAECCSFTCTGTCGAAGGVCAESGSGCDIDSLNGLDEANPNVDAQVEVHAIPESGVYVQLKWDNNGDFDLHLVRESADPPTGRRWNDRNDEGTGNDCYYHNPNPDWGALDQTNGQSCAISTDCTQPPYTTCRGPSGAAQCINSSDDPHLLIDMTTGGGPESIEVKLPPLDVYHIGVDHFPNPLDATKGTASIRVFVGGREIYAQGHVGPLMQGLNVSDFWYVGYLVVPPILADAYLVAADVQVGTVQACSASGPPPPNPCHRATPADYPIIPALP